MSEQIADWVPKYLLAGALLAALTVIFALLKREFSHLEVRLVAIEVELRAMAGLLGTAATKTELEEVRGDLSDLRERVAIVEARCSIKHASQP